MAAANLHYKNNILFSSRCSLKGITWETHRVLTDICVKTQSAAVQTSFKVTCTQSREFVASL